MSAPRGAAARDRFRVSLGWVARLAALWFLFAVVSHGVNVACGLPVRIAAALGGVARALGIASQVTGDTVILPAYRLRIIEECTGLSLAGAMAAFALVAPFAWKTRARGVVLLAGVALVWNALRLVAMLWVVRVAPQRAAFVHDVVWQVGTVLVLLGSAAWWMRTAEREWGAIVWAALRGVAAAGVGVLLWHLTPLSALYGRLLAGGVRWVLAIGLGRPTRLVDAPPEMAPGLVILVASSGTGRPGCC